MHWSPVNLFFSETNDEKKQLLNISLRNPSQENSNAEESMSDEFRRASIIDNTDGETSVLIN